MWDEPIELSTYMDV